MPEFRDALSPDGIVEGYTSTDKAAPQPGYEEQELLARLDELFQGAKKQRSPRHADWEYNKLALHGYTNIGRLRDSDTVLRVLTHRALRKPASTDNVMLPIHRAYVAKMVEALPGVGVRPPSSKASDRQGAQGLTALLDSLTREAKLEVKAIQAFHRTSYTGTAVLHPEWDIFGGEKVSRCAKCGYIGEIDKAGQKCPTCFKQEILRVDAALANQKDQQFEAGKLGLSPDVVPEDPKNPPTPLEENMPKLEPSRRGKLKVNLHRVQEVFFDEGAATLEEAQWFTIEKPYPVQELRRSFPESIDYLTAEAGIHDDRYIGIDQAGRSQLYTRDLKDHMLMRATYEKPSAMHEDGRVIYWVDGKVLEVREYVEYEMFGRHSVFILRADHFDDTDLLGRPPVEDAYPIQDERNKSLRDMRAVRELTAAPKLITLKDSGINQKTLDDTTGQVVLVNRSAAMMKPYWQPVPSMPSYTYNELERMSGAIRDKFGVTPHELGQTKAGESGRYAAFLEAQSKTPLAAIIKENNNEWVDLHRCMLIMAHYYMDDDQLWNYEAQGVMKQYNWREVKLEPPYDVRMVRLDALSNNPVVRGEQADKLFQRGLFNDPDTGVPDLRRYATVAGVEDLVIDADPNVSQKRYARDLIESIRQTGQMPQPKPWDHALIVSQEILTWLRDEGYAEEDEQLVKGVQQLWFGYAQASIQQEQMLMMEKQGMKSAGVQPNPAFMGQGPGAGDTGDDAGAPGSSGPEATNTAAADQTGEGLARPGQNQEGSTV